VRSRRSSPLIDRQRAEHLRDDAHPHLPAPVGLGLLGADDGSRPGPLRSGAALGSAFVAPRLMRRVPPRWLITAAVVVEAAGLVPLIWLNPHSGYVPLVLAATLIEGIGTGLAGPTTLNTALRGVLSVDAGAAGRRPARPVSWARQWVPLCSTPSPPPSPPATSSPIPPQASSPLRCSA
jgi:hypothetical protein